jgi:hypothetical protein
MGVDSRLHAEQKEFEGGDWWALSSSTGTQNLGGELENSSGISVHDSKTGVSSR